jgi:spoIIIJ-associated protein
MDNEEKTEPIQEFKGKNLEEAIGHAEHKLKIARAELNYEIVTEKTKLFGMSKEIVIRAWPKVEAEENAVANFLEKLKAVFPLEISYEIKKKNGIVFVVFDGLDKQLLLWNDGSLLLALQHVLNKVADQKVQVDCEFFRKRKERNLREYAQQIAQRVHDSGKNEILDLMNPYERRIVHIAVNQVPGITSESLGEGFLKRVKVFPVERPPRQG